MNTDFFKRLVGAIVITLALVPSCEGSAKNQRDGASGDAVIGASGLTLLFPRITSPDIIWAGTKELAAGSPKTALHAVQSVTPVSFADSLLYFFKIGTIQAALGNFDIALTALNTVSVNSPQLAPIAMDQVGDIRMSREEYEKAMDAYSSVLSNEGLPERYRHHVFIKIGFLVNSNNISLPDGAVWLEEYRTWEEALDIEPPEPTPAAPTRSREQNRLWMEAWRLELDGKFMQAAEAYREVFAIDDGPRTHEAHIRHALCYYKHRQYDSAIVHLDKFREKFPRSSQILTAMFWQGKSHAAAGRTEEAHNIWNAIAELDPIDYHAHRGKQLMGEEHRILSPVGFQMTDVQTRAWLDSISPPDDKKKLTAEDLANLRRGGALLAVARPLIANLIFWDYERDYFGNLLLQFEMADAYARAGNPALSFSVAHRLAWRVPMQHRRDRPLQLLAVMFPPFYADIITYYSNKYGVDPLFVSAVMRQESIFNYRLVSHAGAIGLMQIMPNTGRSIAQQLELPYDVDSLYSYRYNIRLGVHYLSTRFAMFDGDPVLVLCAYNAGARNAVRWRNNRNNPDDDVFNEDIGFRETRIYVKRVMANYWTNQQLVNTPGYVYYQPALIKEKQEIAE
ncbi:MAG: transglycosylase SLT domain-containing protein [Chitinispirillales bacterium]|nr:transglycosylase SLT domain-containing protein [Chitinispirillales bacterium]